jgi:hypothetical protein
VRVLRREPGFTFFAVLTIALALGANAAIFSLVDGVLPKSAGYPEPERIVQIWLGPQTAWEIVGVVMDEKGRGLESANDIGAYASFAQNPVVGLGIVAKGAGDGGALIQSVARAVTKVEKTQVLERARTVEEMKVEGLMGRRLTTSLLGGLSVLAMLLPCAGIYGVLSLSRRGGDTRWEFARRWAHRAAT